MQPEWSSSQSARVSLPFGCNQRFSYRLTLVPLQRLSFTPPLVLMGVKVTGPTPVPISEIVPVLAAVLPATEMDPAERAAFVGLNVMVIEQLVCGASNAGERGQLLVPEKGAPGCEILAMISGEAPVFVKRTDLAELLAITRLPKFRLVVLRLITCARS
jgi:hypothetical protein